MGVNIWVSSDWHASHKGIVRGESNWNNINECRDFKSVIEHDNYLIDKINNTVGEKDILYFLGDGVMGGRDKIYDFWKRINCKNIHYIGGNHDLHIRKNSILKTEYGFINAQDLFISYNEVVEKKLKKINFVFFHYPIYSFHNMYSGAIHCYGHLHTEIKYNKQAICVAIDNHPDFRPYHIDEIIEKVNNNKNTNYEYFTNISH